MNDKNKQSNQEITSGRFVRNSVILVSIQLFSKTLGLVLFVIMARILGAREIGFFEGTLALANLFAILPTFGFGKKVEKEIGRNHSLLYSHFKEISIIKLSLSIISLLLLWFYLNARGEDRTSFMMVITIYIFLFFFMEFFNSLYRGIGRPEFEAVNRGLLSIINLVFGVTVLILGFGLPGIVGIQLISIILVLLLSLLIINKIAEKVKVSFSWKTIQNHLVTAAPYVGLVVILFLGNQINLVILALLAPKQEIGYFAVANRIFSNITIIPSAIMGAFLPLMSRLFMTSIGGFVRTLRFTLKYLYILSAPIAVGTLVVAHKLTVALFRAEFAPSYLVMILLHLSLIFSFWNFACASLMIARNREKLLMWLFALNATVNVITNVVLISLFSYIGAAITVLITQAMQFLVFTFFIRRYIKIRELIASIALPTLCALAMGVIVYYINFYSVWLAVLGGAVSYFILLKLTGSVHGNDFRRLKGLMIKEA